MHRTLARLMALALIALAALAPSAGASGTAGTTCDEMACSGFFVAGFGVCWYGPTRSDHYFGLNIQCPLDPMPGDTRNGG